MFLDSAQKGAGEAECPLLCKAPGTTLSSGFGRRGLRRQAEAAGLARVGEMVLHRQEDAQVLVTFYSPLSWSY